MIMDRCTDCDELIDTDDFPECYREELDNRLVCDSCLENYDEPPTCANCNGSGEGMYDGTRCIVCNGRGVIVHKGELI